MDAFSWKEMLGFAAVVLAFACYVPYYYGIFFGKVRPHLYTHVIWTFVSVVAVSGMWISGAGAGGWSPIISTLLASFIIPLCLWYGTKDVTRTDLWFMCGALVTIIPWLLTKNPLWSIVLASVIELVGCIPTYRKTWNDPDSESVSSWGLNTVKHMLTIPAMAVFSVETLIYPVVMVLMNGGLVMEILYRKRMLARAD